VRLRGALVALDVSVEVERKGLAVIADRDTALGEIHNDVVLRLQAQVAAGGTVSNATLFGAVQTDTDTYSVKELSYTAEFLDEGLRVTRENPQFEPTSDQQAWVRAVSVNETSETS
jgi:hypothetical protein